MTRQYEEVQRNMSDQESQVSFESMETPLLEMQNLRNAFTEHRQIIAEQDAEIERLKGQIDVRDAVIAKLSGTVAEWRPFLTRAADALDIMTQFLLISDVPLEWEENKRRENHALIAKLRKAAQ